VQAAEPTLRSVAVREAVTGSSLGFLCDAMLSAAATDRCDAAATAPPTFARCIKLSRRCSGDVHQGG